MLWKLDGKLIGGPSGLIACDECPCEPETGTGTEVEENLDQRVRRGAPNSGWRTTTNWSNQLSGTFPWTSVTNAESTDGAYASVNLQTITSPDTSDTLEGDTFGFEIAASATILGVEVEVIRKRTINAGTPEVHDLTVQLIGLGGGVDNKADTGTSWTASDVTVVYGSPSDLWGVSITPAQINATAFGINIAVEATGGASGDIDAQVDSVRIKVHYAA